MRRFWNGFGLEIDEQGYVIRETNVTKHARIQIGDKIVKIEGVSEPSEFESILNLTLKEHITVLVNKMDKKGKILRKAHSEGFASTLKQTLKGK